LLKEVVIKDGRRWERGGEGKRMVKDKKGGAG